MLDCLQTRVSLFGSPRYGGQSRDGGMTHVVGAGDLGQRLPVRTATERLALLVGGELRATAESDATRFRAGASLARAGADQLALKLGQPTEDREHQASMRGRRVCPRIPKGLEPGSFAGDGG